MKKLTTILLTTAFLLTAARQAGATPYASGITNNAGTISFFLNERADNVRVTFNNGTGTPNNLGTLLRGKYTFSLGANTNFSIVVSNASGAGWKSGNGSGGAVKLQISESTNRYMNFENPRGIRVNMNPSSRFFGRIYTSNTRTNATSSNVARPMGVGIYMINPDQTSAHQAGQEDTPLRPVNWPLTLNTLSTGYTFPYNLNIGSDDAIYASDWTDTSGNLWITDAEVQDPGNAVLKLLSGTAALPVGVNNTHGSINAAHIEGTVAGGTLTAWTIDEDLQTDKTAVAPGTQLNSLWRYDVLGNVLPYQNDGVKVWTASGKQGIAATAQTCDMVRSTNGNFFIVMARSAGNESGLAIVSGTGTPLWNSWDASQLIRAGTDLITNTFRVALSADEKYVAVARTTGLVWILPMVNGLPDITNRLALQPFATAARTLRGLAFDPANNLYVSTSSEEYIGVFSPGGTTIATTSNDSSGANGSFNISVPASTVSVTNSIATITENGGTNGVFTITRTGDNSTALTIPYTIGGTAASGVDFTTGSGTVTLAPFQASTNVLVTPIDDSTPELTETVLLTLQGGSGYSVGSPGSATVSILDNDSPQVSFEQVAPGQLLESYAPSRVTYQLTRRGLLTSALTVNLAYSGTATRGADYSAPATVSMGVNVVNANVTLSPINDQIYEGTETIVITVAAGAGYNPASAPSNSISASIIDDEYPPGKLLFSDNFDTDSSTQWTVNLADPSNGSVTFAYDYNAVGIPQAPASGGTKGLQMSIGNLFGQVNGVSCSPLNGSFSGNYRLRFDMWINYNGPMPDGGPGSTQHFDAGVGTAGDQVIWYNNPSADSVWFTASGDGADGAIFGDYSAFIGAVNQDDPTGFYAAGTGGPGSGLRNSSHPFYARWGGQAAPAAQLGLYPNQTGVANTGNAGMAWHTAVITKFTNTVIWSLDGVTIATVTNDPSALSTNIFVGYQDRFAGSVSDVPAMSFGLVDNLRVETYSDAPLVITAITRVGGNVEITFTATTTAVPGDFKLQGSSSVTSGYADDNSAVITQLGAGSFKATTALSGDNQFYRIKM